MSRSSPQGADGQKAFEGWNGGDGGPDIGHGVLNPCSTGCFYWVFPPDIGGDATIALRRGAVLGTALALARRDA
jgi:hypothetical protein